MSIGSNDPLKWVEMAQSWLVEAAGGAHGGLNTGAPECGVCPVCRVAGMLRAADPAVVATVLEAAFGAAAAAAEVLRDAGERLLATDPETLRPTQGQDADRHDEPESENPDHQPGTERRRTPPAAS